MTDTIVTLDVRDDIRDGRHPFERIMHAVAGLSHGQALLLLAPFEPVPLYGTLARDGFTHVTREIGPEHWEVLFTRTGTQAPAETLSPARPAEPEASAGPGGAVVEVDARGLEPPQPMVVILEAVAALPSGGELRARTDRRPLHLYPQLEQRGFTGETVAEDDGTFITRIRRVE